MQKAKPNALNRSTQPTPLSKMKDDHMQSCAIIRCIRIINFFRLFYFFFV